MNLSVGKWTLITTLILLPLTRSWSLDEQRPFKSGLVEFEFSPSYYQADANYTRSGGEYVRLGSGSSYRLIDLNFATRYGWSETIGLWATTRFSSAESSDGSVTRSKGSMTFLQVGFDYLLQDRTSWDLFVDASFLFPLEEVDPDGDDVLNGEGAMEGAFRLISRHRWGFLEPFGEGGFIYRSGGRSALLTYAVGSEFVFSSFSLGADLRGYSSIIEDSNSGDPFEREKVALRNGGALRYYGVDPSLLESDFWVRWLSGSNMFKVGGSIPVTGSATAAGYQIGALWNIAFDSGSYTKSEPIKRKKDDVDRFQEETNDGVDQNIFYKPTLPQPTPPPPPKTKSRKQLQQELDQTEFQIELRRQKKPQQRQ